MMRQLTSAVHRQWLRHGGQGAVAPPNNFGEGQRPSNEYLDVRVD